MATPIEVVCSRLKDVKPRRTGFIAKCPAHDDQKGSLSIREGDDGRVLLRCFAGCATERVVQVIGLEMRDLFPLRHSSADQDGPRRRITATYDYVYETGELGYQVVRYTPKDFKQRRPDSNGGWIWNLQGVKRVLYRLPELLAADPTVPVWVVEGEKDVDNLIRIGLVATTNAEGAAKWQDDFAEVLRDRVVVVIPDNDEAGQRHARRVARSLHGLAKEVRILELPDLPPKGDVSDWLTHGGTGDLLRQLAAEAPRWMPAEHVDDPDSANSENSATAEDATWEAPTLLTDLPRPPFPTDLLPRWLQDFVAAIAIATQTPPALAAMLVLAALATACARKVEVLVRGSWREPLNLFTLVVLLPGERKSAVFGHVVAPIEAFEAALVREAEVLIAEAETRRKIVDQASSNAQTKASKETDPAKRREYTAQALDLARETTELKVPVRPRLIVDDCSPERLASFLAEQDGRIALLAPEGDVFELMAGRYSASGAPNLGAYLRGHAGDALRVDRVKRASEFVSSPALTVGLAVQPEVLAGLATKPRFRGRGLLARFLFGLPESLVGRRIIAPPEMPEQVVTTYRANLTALLRFPAGTDEYGRSQPHVLRLGDAATAELVRFERELEPRLAELGDLGHIRDWAGKLAGAVARIAGLLRLAEHVAGIEPWATPLSLDAMERAVRMGREYLIPHALAAFAQMDADAALAEARYLLRYIEVNRWTSFTKREHFEVTKGRLKRVDALTAPLSTLESHGYVRQRLAEPRSGPGRKPSPICDVNPLWQSPEGPDTPDPGKGTESQSHHANEPAAPSQNSHDSQNEQREDAPTAQAGNDDCGEPAIDVDMPLDSPADDAGSSVNQESSPPAQEDDRTRTAAEAAGVVEPAEPVAYTRITTNEQLVAVLPEVLGADLLGFDLETAGTHANEALDPHAGHVRLIQLATPNCVYIIDCDLVDPNLLAPVFADGPTLIGHNLKFDLRFLLASGLPIPAGDRLFDTMLASQLLHAGTNARHSLVITVERELGRMLDKSSQASNWSGELTEEQLAYAALDAAILLPLAARLREQVEGAGLATVIQLEMDALPAVAWLEHNGAPLDAAAWHSLAVQAETERDEALAAVADLVHGLNPNSGPQVKAQLSARGIDLPSVQEETLRSVQDRHPLIPLLLRYREASKRATTYGAAFLDHVQPATGRIHPNYHQIGAATGRMSCSAPNLQNIPRNPAYRACFRPAEGRVLVKVDLSLIELCVAAELAGDDRMITAITEGHDLHRLTAAALFVKDPAAIAADERAFGKAVNFGTLYGQGRRGLIALAAKHGLALSNADASRVQRRFAEALPRLSAWQRRAMAGTAPVVRTASGRLLRLGPRDSGPVRANTRVQGTAADGFKVALAQLWETRDRHPTAVPVLAVHDELVVECDAAEADAVADWVAGCLQEGMARYVTRVPVRVEVSVAETWAGRVSRITHGDE